MYHCSGLDQPGQRETEPERDEPVSIRPFEDLLSTLDAAARELFRASLHFATYGGYGKSATILGGRGKGSTGRRSPGAAMNGILGSSFSKML
jgi:hypothetical protein